MLTTLFPAGFWTIAARVVGYVMLFGIVLRALGAAFGPTVKAYFPGVYPALARAGGFLLALSHDVIGALGELRGETAVPAPPAGPPTQPPSGAS